MRRKRLRKVSCACSYRTRRDASNASGGLTTSAIPFWPIGISQDSPDDSQSGVNILCFSELSARPTRGADACQSLRQLEMVVEGSIWPFFSGIWAHSPRRLLLEA